MKTITTVLWFAIVFIGASLSTLAWINILTSEGPSSDPFWERVPTPRSSSGIIRMPVPHGWLVAYKSVSRGLVYIPDAKHEWKFNPSGKTSN